MQRIRRDWIVLISCLININAKAQHLIYPAKGPLGIFAAQYSPSAVDPLIFSANPSIIPGSPTTSVAVFMERKYLNKELVMFGVAALSSIGKQSLAISFSHFGSLSYREKNLTLAWGRSLGQISIGMLAAVHTTQVAEIMDVKLYQTSFACRLQLHEHTYSTFRINNVHALFSKDQQAYLPAPSFTAGIGYEASTSVYLGLECERHMERRTDATILFQYIPHNNYKVRASWNSESHQPYFGLAWTQEKFTIETGFSYHFILGVSPAVTIQYRAKEGNHQ